MSDVLLSNTHAFEDEEMESIEARDPPMLGDGACGRMQRRRLSELSGPRWGLDEKSQQGIL